MQLLHQVLSILLLHAVREVAASCSVFCACKWKNGKQTVECADKSLPEIPEGMDPETQVLEFSGNKLNKLSKELFLKKQLVNLQRLYLSTCKIKSVHKDTFKGLTNLVELDLSDNLLENVPSAALLNCPALMKLTLNFNPVSQLKKLAFNHLSYLNTLELSNCQISEIEEGAFQGLHSLEWLRLDGNRLKTIRGRRTLPENVKGVDLQKNPWECDCRIQELSAWLGDFSVPLSVEPTCQGPPRLAGRLVESIPSEELACLPDISPTSFYLELGKGKMLQNNTMVAPGLHLVYFIEEEWKTNAASSDNAAGSSQSNFTIKIVLKEDPIVIIVAFPLEYFLLAAIGISALGVLVLVVVAVSIVRCHRRSRRQQKRDQTKECGAAVSAECK
ncbi:hypothetical protein NQ318_015302 [Aromia moschata]|uniref:LRRCT domain-containing protein n=1 Tax=Aromia moschata TaxID=1265417 RepID=A0AAV8X3Z7_9CUCU|nr:hypothetical protein NQ318_015302 [Aromia moschata]